MNLWQSIQLGFISSCNEAAAKFPMLFGANGQNTINKIQSVFMAVGSIALAGVGSYIIVTQIIQMGKAVGGGNPDWGQFLTHLGIGVIGAFMLGIGIIGLLGIFKSSAQDININ